MQCIIHVHALTILLVDPKLGDFYFVMPQAIRLPWGMDGASRNIAKWIKSVNSLLFEREGERERGTNCKSALQISATH